MKRLIVVVFGLCGAVTTALAAEPPREKTLSLDWHLSLAADGRVIALEAKGDAPVELRKKLEQSISSWDFVPGKVDGQPAATETRLSVQLALLPSADGSQFGVRVIDVRTGGSVAKPGAIRFGANVVRNELGSAASVVRQIVVEVSYDKEGRPTKLIPAATSQVQNGRLFEGVEKSLRRWTFEPERVAGIGVAGTVVIPICFAVGAPSEARRLSQSCSWSPPGSNASVEQGQSLALDSSVSLKNEVVGSML